MREFIDLYTHSLITEGSYSPREVVKNAYKNNIKVLVLTDHDSIGGISEATEEFLHYIILKYNLLSSGGTDYHGEYRKNNDIGISNGSFCIEYEKIKFLKERFICDHITEIS